MTVRFIGSFSQVAGLKHSNVVVNPATLSSGPSVPTDPYFSDLLFLMHGDGSVADTSGHLTMTNNAYAGLSSTQMKFGTGSLQFSGSSGVGYVRSGILPGSMALGTRDWTFECWANINGWASASGYTNADYACLASLGAPGGNATNSLGFFVGGTTASNVTVQGWASWTGDGSTQYKQNCTLTGVTQNQWNHYAWTRHGGNVYSFCNGQLLGTQPFTQSIPWASGAYYWNIGSLMVTNYQYPLNGWLDEVRFTVDVARYTTSFTVPTAAFPNA